MPGMKDFKSVVTPDGQRKHLQKRLILCNLREAYVKFKAENPLVRIGFSKFASLRPKQVVLPGASGTHSVCVCTIHQNVKLMLDGSKISSLQAFRTIVGEDYDDPITYKHMLACLACNPTTPDCFFGRCANCPSSNNLENLLLQIFEGLSIDNVTYKSWIATDRTSLETLVKNSDDFCEILVEMLISLQRHDFFARQQSLYLKQLKDSPMESMVVVISDFAENYSFILQDAVQGFHWTNSQATIHPFVVYYKLQTGMDDSLHSKSFVIISDCLKHDTSAVYCFQKNLMKFLDECIPSDHNKVIYFSDGAASQYKNRKNFSNLIHHYDDFGKEAEWHFFATSHGKGPCDGVGGTVKRLAARASIQMTMNNHIQTPLQLYEFARDNVPSVKFSFVSSTEVENEAIFLKHRFDTAIPIPGTQKFHTYLPITDSKNFINVKEYSASIEVTKVQIGKIPYENPTWDDIKGFVTCIYDQKWWLACIIDKEFSNQRLHIKFLHPHGPSTSFCYPSHDDLLHVFPSDILSVVYPSTATGRTYSLSREEVEGASKRLTHYLLDNS